MPDLKTILSAQAPLTLAGVPTGFQPSLLADLARAAKTRAVFIAPDDAAMRAIASSAAFFAPDLEILSLPAWDCLPYDRASPTLRVMAERVAALQRLQGKPKGPQLLLTTANAATQRVLTPFRIRQLVARLAPGERIGRDKLATLLQANGYVRTDTVHDQGEYAVPAVSSTCIRRARTTRCGSTSSVTRSRASAASTPPTSARSIGSTASPCCPRPRCCSTPTA